jgi:dTDP-4-dehydrorhamnose reductase
MPQWTIGNILKQAEKKMLAYDRTSTGILVLGGDGQVGGHLRDSLGLIGNVTVLTRAEADLSRPDFEKKVLERLPKNLKMIVNAAAYTKVDLAETERETARAVNAVAPGILAEIALKNNALLTHYSTDYVYDGKKTWPYTEEDPTGPLNWYGETKLAGDRAIMSSGCRYVIFRTSWVYDVRGKNFPKTILKLAEEVETLEMDETQVGSPTPAPLLANSTLYAGCFNIILDNGTTGLFHLTPQGSCTWLQFARYLVELATMRGLPIKLKPENIVPRKGPDTSRPAQRPLNSRLSIEKFSRAFGHKPDPWYLLGIKFMEIFAEAHPSQK